MADFGILDFLSQSWSVEDHFTHPYTYIYLRRLLLKHLQLKCWCSFALNPLKFRKKGGEEAINMQEPCMKLFLKKKNS